LLDKLPAVAPCSVTILGLKVTFETSTPYCKTQTFYEKWFALPHQHSALKVQLRSRKYPLQKSTILLSRIVVTIMFLTDGDILNFLSIDTIVFQRHVCLLGFECCVINFCFVPRNDVPKKFMPLIGETCII
jgi:hypothetical protein